ncbi:MAG: hypothetical protein WBW92_00705 [Rhodanobacteraceae bacterium]
MPAHRNAPASARRAAGPRQWLAWRLCLALALLLALPALSEPIEPPLQQLFASSNSLVVTRLRSVDARGQLVFEVQKVLSGSKPQTESLAFTVSRQLSATLESGKRYVLAYSILRPDPRNRLRQIANPRAPVLLRTPGLDPALLPDSHLLRAILHEARELVGEDEQDEDGNRHPSRELTDLLLKALNQGEPQLQNLAANQLALDPEIAGELSATQKSRLGQMVEDAGNSPLARSALLQAAFRYPGRYGQWWPEAARTILAKAPISGYGDKNADLDGLAMVSFSVLQGSEVELPAGVLERWIPCENPALAERALLMLRKQAPAREAKAVEAALADSSLPPRTRQFLQGYQRRQKLLQERRERARE